MLFVFSLFFFNDTATTEIYTLSLHDALPISGRTRTTPTRCNGSSATHSKTPAYSPTTRRSSSGAPGNGTSTDRKSTRLNSSHANISYAVFCLKKKKNNKLGCEKNIR